MTSECGYSSRAATARHCSGHATLIASRCERARLLAVSPPSATPTRLQQALTGDAAPRRPTPVDAFLLARRKFLAAERIDMSALADELGVNRVTLYRWVGSREQLLVEGLWSLAPRAGERVGGRVRGRGWGGIVRVVPRFLGAVISNGGRRRWLAGGGGRGMRLLPRHDTDFQPRLIDAI